MSTHNIYFYGEMWKIISKLSLMRGLNILYIIESKWTGSKNCSLYKGIHEFHVVLFIWVLQSVKIISFILS